MEEIDLKIRRAGESDSQFLFNLRNEEAVRENSWNTNPVNLESHKNWLAKSLVMSRRFLFVAEADGQPVGQIRYDLNDDGESAEVNISVTSTMHGKGLGTKMLVGSAKEFLKTKPKVKIIYAHIKPNNPGSVRVFEKSGYRLTETTEFDGHACVEMILLNRP